MRWINHQGSRKWWHSSWTLWLLSKRLGIIIKSFQSLVWLCISYSSGILKMMPKKSSLQEVQEIILLMTVIGQRQLGPFIPYQLRTMMTVSLRLQYLRYIVVKLAGLSNFIFLTQCVFSNRCYILRGLSKVGDHLRLRLTPLHIHSLHRAGPWMEQRFALLHYQLCVVAQCIPTFTGIHGIHKT